MYNNTIRKAKKTKQKEKLKKNKEKLLKYFQNCCLIKCFYENDTANV